MGMNLAFLMSSVLGLSDIPNMRAHVVVAMRVCASSTPGLRSDPNVYFCEEILEMACIGVVFG